MASPLIGTALRTGANYASNALKQAAPELKTKALDYVRKATSGRIKTVDQVVEYASKSKNNLAVVAINAAKAGIPPGELLPEQYVVDSQIAELQALQGRVKAAFATSYQAIDADSVIKSDGKQETMMLSIAVINEVSDLLGIRSDTGLTKAHVHLRMWMAMSEAEHTQALQFRKVARGGRN